MSPHVLEFFALPGTSELAVHGRFTLSTSTGSVSLPTVIDFHLSMNAEFVEQTWADLRHLLSETPSA